MGGSPAAVAEREVLEQLRQLGQLVELEVGGRFGRERNCSPSPSSLAFSSMGLVPRPSPRRLTRRGRGSRMHLLHVAHFLSFVLSILVLLGFLVFLSCSLFSTSRCVFAEFWAMSTYRQMVTKVTKLELREALTVALVPL